jgi:hypothetical protein
MAALAVAGATVIGLLIVASSGGSAIAGWTPEPQPADAATVAFADEKCRYMVSNVYPGLGPVEWTDARGNGLVLVYALTPETLLICQYVTDSDGGRILGGGAGNVDLSRPLTGAVQIDGIQWGDDGITVVIGRAAPEVDHVLVTAPGWIATASQHDGYWLAWWPAAIEHASDVSVAAFDRQGQQIGTTVTPPFIP